MINFFILRKISGRNPLRYILDNKRILLPYIHNIHILNPKGEFFLVKTIFPNTSTIFSKSFSFLVENSYL